MLKKIFRFFKKKKKYILLAEEYKNYDLAKKNIISDTNYLNLEMIKKINFSENIEKSTFNRHFFTSNFCSKEKNINNILEFGAGAEPTFKYIIKENKNEILNYVIETKELVNEIKIPKNLLKNLVYLNDFKTLDFNLIDIVIFNSSIQYIEDFENILKKIVDYKIKYVVITDTVFSDFDEDIFALQINIRPTKFVYIILSFKKIHDYFIKKNYKLIQCITEKKHLGESKEIEKIHETISNENLNFKNLIFKFNG